MRNPQTGSSYTVSRNLEFAIVGNETGVPHMASTLEIEAGPYWWEASAFTIAPSLLPLRRVLLDSFFFFFF